MSSTDPARRTWLVRLAAGSGVLASGCDLGSLAGAGRNVSAAAAPAAPLAARAQVDHFLQQHPLPPRARHAQTYLFQGVPLREIPSRLPQGRPFFWDLFGPTHHYVDALSGWAWSRPGGDWIDARGERHGPQPWFVLQADAVDGNAQSASYTIEVTRLVEHVHAQSRWLALLLSAPTAPRVVSGTASGRAHFIEVIYTDGQQARLACRLVAAIGAGVAVPSTAAAEVRLPAVLEFERPRAPVRSARLRLVVTQHWSGRNPVIVGQLIDPPVHVPSVRPGPAQAAAPLDADLAQRDPAVIGLHRYLDGTSLEDFVHADGVSLHSEALYDPAIYGRGEPDTSKLPHVGHGKWLNAGSRWELVRSDHPDEGFAPLAPGLGALRLHMPAAPGLSDGATVGRDGTLAGHAMILLPEPLYGRLDRMFVRYYVRLGLPGRATPRDRLQLLQAPGQTAWASLSGKFGIGPDHSTSLGGVSGGSGGGGGWQMRLSWQECDAANGGPDERGWAPGFHLYDFLSANPPGHRYGSEKPPQFERWGQLSSAGSMLYAGHWYCIETELQLNRIASAPPGYVPDGALRAWVDGRLVFERTSMVFRSLPLREADYHPNRLRPCRELGVRGLWLNWFHGGQTPSTIDRTLFYTGLAWSRQYIGPMKMPD